MNHIVVAKTYTTRFAAELDQGILAAHGIEAMVQADDVGGYYAFLQAAQGLRLLVREEDVEIAQQILATPPPTSTT